MYSDRVNSLPPYLFAAIDEAKEKAISRGVDVIDLGVGDPDMPAPEHVVEALCMAARDPSTHRYPSYTGLLEFREAVAEWYAEHLGVELDASKEVLTLIGSKEGIAHAPLAFLNPGDVALVPDPAYPVYGIGAMFAGGVSYKMPLLKDNGFLPDLEAIPEDVASRAKIMFLNYPNNPTSAVADVDFYEEVVEFARKHDIIVFSDNAYSELCFDGYRAPSFLNAEGAMEVGVEFHSLSKTYNMTGWRIGFVVGNERVVAGIGKIKTNVDSGAFEAVQRAGIAAMRGSQEFVEEMRRIYVERRDVLIKGLEGLGIKVAPPKATFYIWAPVPDGFTSIEFSTLLLEKAGIVATPGVGFGEYGEGYLRFALTQPVERISEAVERMRELEL
jgi:LL-diaminopimelate aminotransferase